MLHLCAVSLRPERLRHLVPQNGRAAASDEIGQELTRFLDSPARHLAGCCLNLERAEAADSEDRRACAGSLPFRVVFFLQEKGGLSSRSMVRGSRVGGVGRVSDG